MATQTAIEYALCATRKGESREAEEIIAQDSYPLTEGQLRLAALCLDAKGYDRVRLATVITTSK